MISSRESEKTLLSEEPTGVLFHLEACQAPPSDYGRLSRFLLAVAALAAVALAVLR